MSLVKKNIAPRRWPFRVPGGVGPGACVSLCTGGLRHLSAAEVGLGVLPEHTGRVLPEHYVPNLIAALSRAVRRDVFFQ